jgi:hypothetical protein
MISSGTKKEKNMFVKYVEKQQTPVVYADAQPQFLPKEVLTATIVLCFTQNKR